MPTVKELQVGDTAPDFTLPSSDGQDIRLKDFQGKQVVLYFYPRDMTPGCTQEACDFRDKEARLKKIEAVVLGVSFDSVDSHRKFIKKYKLSFPLLSDDQKKVAEMYGVYQKKSLYGRFFMGIQRSTFCIGRDGKIIAIFPKVRVKGHVDEVMEILKKAS
jgi:thioredoxin-dependent peroxiredoxin